MEEQISFQCNSCKTRIDVSHTKAGGATQCPSCNEHVDVPTGIASGEIIGDFKIIKLLGVGGMGEVWLAHQDAMDRDVALKILSPSLTKDANFVNRFLAEVKTAAKLEHQNIISAYHAGQHKELHYLATSFVDGEELGEMLERIECVKEKDALLVMRDIAEALKYAWDKFSILHRDIKPANIMRQNDGTGKLMDMGIAKSLTSQDTSMTMTGVIVGTPNYMSPEQARGEKDIDCRSDIYAFGATLFELVTGKLPFEAPTPMGTITKHLTEPLPNPKTINPGISKQLAVLIQVLMEKDKIHRQENWDEVLEDIDNVIKGEYPAKFKKYNKTSGLYSVAIILFLIIGGLIFAIFNKEKIQNFFSKKNKNESVANNDNSDLNNKSIKRIGNDNVIKTPKTESIATSSVADFANIDKSKIEFTKQQSEKNWKEATRYAKENPKNYKTIIELYKVCKKGIYEGAAIIEISKIEKQQITAKSLEILNSLKIEAEQLAKENMFSRAAELYRNYNGNYAKETEIERLHCAKKYDKKAAELANKEIVAEKIRIKEIEEKRKLEIAKKETDKEVDKLIIELEELVFNKKYNDAFQLLKSKKDNKLYSENKKLYFSTYYSALEVLIDQNSALLDVFKTLINKNITLDCKNKRYKGKIEKVTNKILAINYKGVIIKIEPEEELDESQIQKYLSIKNKVAGIIFQLNTKTVKKNKNLTKLVIEREKSLFKSIFPKKCGVINKQIKEKEEEKARIKQAEKKGKKVIAIKESLNEILKTGNCNIKTPNNELIQNFREFFVRSNNKKDFIFNIKNKILKIEENVNKLKKEFKDFETNELNPELEKVMIIAEFIKEMKKQREKKEKFRNRDNKNFRRSDNYNNNQPNNND